LRILAFHHHGGHLDMAGKVKFTREQQKAHDDFKKLIADIPEADRQYDRLEASAKGKIISTDVARFLDKRYAATPKAKGKLRDIAPGWDLAWRYAQDRLEREILNRRRREIVRFMAGGWAAGKTHALEKEQSPDLAWDGTLKDPDWAVEMIELALTHGWKVEIAYVYRDMELCFYGAIERAVTEGRSVPLNEIPSVHRAVQESISALYNAYFDHSNVSFLFLHNVGTRDVRSTPFPITISELETGGALHHTQTHESYFSKAANHLARASGS
jgi:hypothetical protein